MDKNHELNNDVSAHRFPHEAAGGNRSRSLLYNITIDLLRPIKSRYRENKKRKCTNSTGHIQNIT